METTNQETVQPTTTDVDTNNQSVNVAPTQGTTYIEEGKARIHNSTQTQLANEKIEKQEAFYNPVMIFNRDISILVIQTYAELLKKETESQNRTFEGIHILDALSASGLRPIRFLKEIRPELIQKVHANDISENALKHMRDNFKLNGIDESKIVQHQDDANNLMWKSKDQFWPTGPGPVKYDVIDLDPYGTAVPFLDTAVQAIKEGGLLCVTCTDLKVLSGPDYHKCFYMYGVTRSKMTCHQENAVRVVLYTINAIANKYAKYIVPYISYQSEYYLRVFVRVYTSKTECGRSMLKYGHVYYCPESSYFITHNLASKNEKGSTSFNKMKLDLSKCPATGENFALNGPLWFEDMNNIEFVKLLQERIAAPDQNLELATQKRISAMLHGIIQQGDLAKYPLSVSVEKISKYLSTSIPSRRYLDYFVKKHGFRIAPCYMFPNLYKTDAPPELFFDFVKEWRRHYCKVNNMDYFRNIREGGGAYYCLNRPVQYTADFDVDIPKSKEKKVAMFFPNPEKNWGPMRKATNRKVVDKDGEEEADADVSSNVDAEEEKEPVEEEKEVLEGETPKKLVKKD